MDRQERQPCSASHQNGIGAGVLIVGGGLAAQRCCETLRKGGYLGKIRIACAEDRRPYDRPPLSKECLAGERPVADAAFRAAAWYAEHGVELLLGSEATALDIDAQEVSLADGTTARYEHLLVATGSTARRLDLFHGASNVGYLRTAADADRLKMALASGTRLVVIGAGFIGQEVAATARALGAEVTMLEALPAPLERVLGDELGGWFAHLHGEEGVDVHCSTTVAEVVTDSAGRVTTLVTGDGRRIDCDIVVVGVGVLPADAWLYGSGIGGGHFGVETDPMGNTAAPHVYAAGDVARAFDVRVGAHLRSEHWEAAARQATAVAHTILGREPQPAPLASFWSDQYGLRMQYLGYASEADDMTIDGNLAARDFTVTWTRSGQPVAALLVDRRRQLPALRHAIDQTFAHPTEWSPA